MKPGRSWARAIALAYALAAVLTALRFVQGDGSKWFAASMLCAVAALVCNAMAKWWPGHPGGEDAS